KPNNNTMPCWTTPPWQHNLNQMASGNPGAVHNSLVARGKIRYWGLSNIPAWFVAQLATLARVHGLTAPIGLQYFYSLVERGVEDEHVPLAREFGMGIIPWSPLAYGLLTGKYDRAMVEAGLPRTGGVPDHGGMLGGRSLAYKQRQGAIAVARGARNGNKVSLKRVSTVATYRPL
ncbi:MAG: aldo/keto reductase, partial [Sphingomonadales bacterium]|nr:aldo/keto reductase [Sphingomonadales bacterium]